MFHANEATLLLRAGLLFDWLHPAHFATIVAALEAWADVPEVRTGSQAQRHNLPLKGLRGS